ncbi:MAG: hypothetical protein HC900_04445 [Methylacidiphilales bacterium]|nr:hypothetical protein [Candidatus Methylacidiphilales bacterium]
MVDLAAIIAGAGSLKSAMEIAGSLLKMRDRVMVDNALAELMSKLVSAQVEQLALVEKIREMDARLNEIDTWNETRDRYYLRDFGGNTFAYELKREFADSEPIHRICPNCYSLKRVSVLQFRLTTGTQQQRWDCPACEKQFFFGNYVPRALPRQQRYNPFSGL